MDQKKKALRAKRKELALIKSLIYESVRRNSTWGVFDQSRSNIVSWYMLQTSKTYSVLCGGYREHFTDLDKFNLVKFA